MPYLIPKWASLAWLCEAQTHSMVLQLGRTWKDPGSDFPWQTLPKIEKEYFWCTHWPCIELCQQNVCSGKSQCYGGDIKNVSLADWLISFHCLNVPTGPRRVTNL